MTDDDAVHVACQVRVASLACTAAAQVQTFDPHESAWEIADFAVPEAGGRRSPGAARGLEEPRL